MSTRRLRRSRVAFIAIAPVLAACSVMTSLDGLSGGASDSPTWPGAGADDARAGGGDDSGGVTLGDAANDSGGSGGDDAADAAPPIDAAPAPDGDAAPSGSFCAAHTAPTEIFCDDFDMPQPLTRFTSVAKNGGTLTIDGARFTSSPYSLLASVGAASSGQPEVAAYRAFPAYAARPTTFTVSFAMRVEALDQSHGHAAVVMGFETDDSMGDTWQLQLVLDGTSNPSNGINVRLPEYWAPGDGGPTGYSEHQTGITVPFGSWIHATLTVTLSGGFGTNGNTATLSTGSASYGTSLNVQTYGGMPQLDVGPSWVGTPSDAWQLRYDDVLVDAR